MAWTTAPLLALHQGCEACSQRMPAYSPLLCLSFHHEAGLTSANTCSVASTYLSRETSPLGLALRSMRTRELGKETPARSHVLGFRPRARLLFEVELPRGIIVGKQLCIATPIDDGIQLLARLARAEGLLQLLQQGIFAQHVVRGRLELPHNPTQQIDPHQRLFAEDLLFLQHARLGKALPFGRQKHIPLGRIGKA